MSGELPSLFSIIASDLHSSHLVSPLHVVSQRQSLDTHRYNRLPKLLLLLRNTPRLRVRVGETYHIYRFVFRDIILGLRADTMVDRHGAMRRA